MLQEARHIPRFSIVKYSNRIWVLENQIKRPQLIRENEKGERVGMTIFKDTMVEVIKYPAQLAFEALPTLQFVDEAPKATNESDFLNEY